MKGKIPYGKILIVLQNIASHFCSAKVSFRKIPRIKNPSLLQRKIYPDTDFIPATYKTSLNEIWVNKNELAIKIFNKFPEHFFHEIYHAKHPKIPPKLSLKRFSEFRIKEEIKAKRWGLKKAKYFKKHPERLKYLRATKGKYWKEQ
jgi:hypothetical protein